jgi:hypothetical protein
MKFEIKWCKQCQAPYVECPKCGNNCCNGSSGSIIDGIYYTPWEAADLNLYGKPCDGCELAYQKQEEWLGDSQ